MEGDRRRFRVHSYAGGAKGGQGFCAWVSVWGGYDLRLRTENKMRKQAGQGWGADDSSSAACSGHNERGHPSGDMWVWSLGLNL